MAAAVHASVRVPPVQGVRSVAEWTITLCGLGVGSEVFLKGELLLKIRL